MTIRNIKSQAVCEFTYKKHIFTAMTVGSTVELWVREKDTGVAMFVYGINKTPHLTCPEDLVRDFVTESELNRAINMYRSEYEDAQV